MEPDTKNIRLDSVDQEILKSLFRYRYVTIDLLHSIKPSLSYSAWTKRLRKLLKYGYIDRPPKQLWTYRRHERAIYALDQRGADYLKDMFDYRFPRTVKWHEKNRRYRGQDPFSHPLKTARFLSDLENALSVEGMEFYHQDELFGVDYVTGVGWDTFIPTEFTTLTPKLKPDGVFSITRPGRPGPLNFCLEIDLGTMPIRSTHMDRSSILKKFICYRDTHLRGVLKEKFGFCNFRVLMVTTTETRAQNMRELWAKEFGELPQLCMFSSFEVIDKYGVLSAWTNAQHECAQLLP